MGPVVYGRWGWVGEHQSLPSPTKLTQITVVQQFLSVKQLRILQICQPQNSTVCGRACQNLPKGQNQDIKDPFSHILPMTWMTASHLSVKKDKFYSLGVLCQGYGGCAELGFQKFYPGFLRLINTYCIFTVLANICSWLTSVSTMFSISLGNIQPSIVISRGS